MGVRCVRSWRARFGLGMAPSGISAARKEGFEGRSLSPRRGCAGLYVANGMAREATRGLGGRKSPAEMEGVYTKSRTEGVIPEMRSAQATACSGLEVGLLAKDLDRDVCSEASGILGAEKGVEVRVWFHRFRPVRELLVPVVVLPIRGNFWPLMARRVRSLELSGHQRKEMLV